MTLCENQHPVRRCQSVSRWEEESDVQDHTVQQPAEPQRPPSRGVPAQTPPAEHQVQAEGLAGDQAREEDHHGGDRVPCGLEHGDLAQDLERGEVRQGTCSRGAAPWHGGARAGLLGNDQVLVLLMHRGSGGEELRLQHGVRARQKTLASVQGTEGRYEYVKSVGLGFIWTRVWTGCRGSVPVGRDVAWRRRRPKLLTCICNTKFHLHFSNLYTNCSYASLPPPPPPPPPPSPSFPNHAPLLLLLHLLLNHPPTPQSLPRRRFRSPQPHRPQRLLDRARRLLRVPGRARHRGQHRAQGGRGAVLRRGGDGLAAGLCE